MKQRSILIALRLAQFIEEYSESEISDAVKILEKQGHGSSLLAYLSEFKRTSEFKGHKNILLNKQSIAESPDTLSRAVLKLQEVDPEKFRILSGFELAIRKNKILPTHESLKRFGEHISKSFAPRKSRRETIATISTLLTDLSIPEIENQIEFASSFKETSKADQYQILSKYLIKGKNMENKSDNE